MGTYLGHNVVPLSSIILLGQKPPKPTNTQAELGGEAAEGKIAEKQVEKDDNPAENNVVR